MTKVGYGEIVTEHQREPEVFVHTQKGEPRAVKGLTDACLMRSNMGYYEIVELHLNIDSKFSLRKFWNAFEKDTTLHVSVQGDCALASHSGRAKVVALLAGDGGLPSVVRLRFGGWGD